MKYFPIVFIIILFQSCNKKKEEKQEVRAQTAQKQDKTKIDSAVQNTPKVSDEVNDGQDDVMLAKDIRFNGKLERIFDVRDFEKVFGKADSTKLMADEQPCSYIFEDGNINDKYLYKNGSCFENTGQKAGVSSFRFLNGNFILYKGIRIDSKTTLEDIKKIFPNSVRNMSHLETYSEGELPMITLREDKEGTSDGHINMYFKNEKIYSISWWFPC
ncbi:hypothetical protein PYS58_09725 [Chryseobacterium indologenes]|uniref:hypothetical protein n=1 Tax=Chryseobacterium indologenes TaxID=253 RepID=UPI0023E7C462|nr:hypothetical protein [Chryseobacterium indologenes]MDM1555582.1 hypothetical protein [Chryseobacterium indologenes]WET51406.1 hypothetical protein PYS58_09725 [Chryseobacterium indologenes]